MIGDLKVVLFIVMAAVLSAVIRFKSLAQFCIDAVLGFIVGYCCYLFLGFWVADGAVRSGFVGIVILESRPLYDWAEAFIKTKLSELLERHF